MGEGGYIILYDYEIGKRGFNHIKSLLEKVKPEKVEIELMQRQISVTFGDFYPDFAERFDCEEQELFTIKEKRLSLAHTFELRYGFGQPGKYAEERIAQFRTVPANHPKDTAIVYRAGPRDELMKHVLNQAALRFYNLPKAIIYQITIPIHMDISYENEPLTPEIPKKLKEPTLEQTIAFVHDKLVKKANQQHAF